MSLPSAGPSSSAPHRASNQSISGHHVSVSPSLDDEIRRFWEIEEVPRRDHLSPDDEQCEAHFVSTHTRTADGRYVVRLPFNSGPPINLGESYSRAKKQVESLARRLHAKPEEYKDYASFLEEYERLDHMCRAPITATSAAQCVYLPHHPVFRESSSTSRIRVVFNASSRTANGTSLNDHLHCGPKLQTDLASVILRWRAFKYVYSADIAKMYRQIRVHPEDTRFQHILWKPTPQADLIDFCLLTVTYGTACAPFLAHRVIKQLALDDGARLPLAARILRDNIYVDDVLFGHDEITGLRQLRNQLIELLQRGGFDLRKWASNSGELLADIDPTDHGLACSKTLLPDDNLKILGLVWNPHLDVFQFAVRTSDTAPDTKRTILSSIARLYDPLGWVTPVTITAKIMMQHLWRAKVGWDDPIPSALAARWRVVFSRLPSLNQLKIPRWNTLGPHVQRLEIHGFADASNAAYAAVVYLRVISPSDEIHVSIVAAKSRVAPLKPMTVPRLELSAALLLARLIRFVRESVTHEVSSCSCWTDSTVVLAWLKQHPSVWKTFVSNRVSDIQSLLPGVTWRHVSTADNPADCASRGLSADELCDHPLWWHGPPWLQQSADSWPISDPQPRVELAPEAKTTCLLAAEDPPSLELALRFSSWPKLVRVTAYIQRFVNRCRKSYRDQRDEDSGAAISASEFAASRIFWLQRLQAVLFPTELACVRQNRCVPSKSPLLALSPFLDRDGVLRVGGRLKNAPIPFDARHPILLASHPLVARLVEDCHKRVAHGGLQLTSNALRREFWLIRARSFVRGVIFRCVACTRARAAVPSQIMADLPAYRVSAPTRCFQHCGLDYAGPLLVRSSPGRGTRTRKAYIALFICLATRAVHLELVSDYSTSAFLAAFTRFCARRGFPQNVYSDNGTTFVGADRELTTAFREAIRDSDVRSSVASDRITWHFLPPSAPHFGGIWEAGVKSVKHHLRRVMGGHTLTFEELTTLLYSVEACLNSRPLAPLSDSYDDFESLTPGHFLVGSPLTTHPEPSTLEINENRLSRWQRVRHLTERFWKLWQHDYVNTLQQRQKWRKPQPTIQPGRLVLLCNPALPPCKWELGRITQCHAGADGHVRVVSVKTATSEFKRPIVKIVLLPVTADD